MKSKTDDYAQLDIVQAGTKDIETSLTVVYVFDVEHIEFLLTNYSNGALKWIDAYIYLTIQGREKVWMLEEIFNLNPQTMEVIN